MIIKNSSVSADPSNWWDGAWDKRVNITVVETGGIERINEVADYWVNFTTLNCTKEYRIIDHTVNPSGVETVSQVYNETYDPGSGRCVSANILFMVNLTANERRNYTLYWNNSGVSAPSYSDLVMASSTLPDGEPPKRNINATGQNYFINVTNNGGVHSIKITNHTQTGGPFFSFILRADGDGQVTRELNASLVIDGPLMAKSGIDVPLSQRYNSTIKIYPFYTEIEFQIDGSLNWLEGGMGQGEIDLPPSSQKPGMNYTYFGNSTLYSTSSVCTTNNCILTDGDFGLHNYTYLITFSNNSMNAFYFVISNITSHETGLACLEEDDSSGWDDFQLGASAGNCDSAGFSRELDNTTFFIRLGLTNNFSYQTAEAERLKLYNRLTFATGREQAFRPVIINISPNEDVHTDRNASQDSGHSIYLKFPINNIPQSSEIIKAELILNATAITGGANLRAYNCTSIMIVSPAEEWTESSSFPSVTSLPCTNTGNSTNVNSLGLKYWDISSYVQGMHLSGAKNITIRLNATDIRQSNTLVNGTFLRGGWKGVFGGTSYANFNSREVGAFTPVLNITYIS